MHLGEECSSSYDNGEEWEAVSKCLPEASSGSFNKNQDIAVLRCGDGRNGGLADEFVAIATGGNGGDGNAANGFCGANGGVGGMAIGTASVADGGNGVGSQNGGNGGIAINGGTASRASGSTSGNGSRCTMHF